MENIAINRLMRLINSLSIESKLEVLTKLSESLKGSINPKNDSKERLLEELYGAWNDVEDDLANDILNSRSISNKDISFD